jgi:hypothetical protein
MAELSIVKWAFVHFQANLSKAEILPPLAVGSFGIVAPRAADETRGQSLTAAGRLFPGVKLRLAWDSLATEKE